MAIPRHNELYGKVLKLLSDKKVYKTSELKEIVASQVDLTDELDRQYEVINKFDNNIQIYFKGNEVIKLSPKEVQSFRDAEELLKEDLDLKEDGTILKEQYTLMLEELIKKVQDLQEQVEKQEQYIEETNNRNGW